MLLNLPLWHSRIVLYSRGVCMFWASFATAVLWQLRGRRYLWQNMSCLLIRWIFRATVATIECSFALCQSESMQMQWFFVLEIYLYNRKSASLQTHDMENRMKCYEGNWRSIFRRGKFRLCVSERSWRKLILFLL